MNEYTFEQQNFVDVFQFTLKNDTSRFSDYNNYYFHDTGYSFEPIFKNICEVFLFERILVRKKILWRINFVFIKFLPNALFFEKLQNEYKNSSFLYKVYMY